MSNTLYDDFEYVLSVFQDLKSFENSSVLITGGTGFLGSLIVKMLDYANKKKNLNMQIIAFTRSREKAEELSKTCNVRIVFGDISEPLVVDGDIDYIFHTAAITKSREMIESPVEVIEGIVNGTQNVLKLAYKKRVKSIVFLSSMEVYGLTDQAIHEVKEEDLGYVAITDKRSCYPLSKRMSENICISYFEEYKVPVKIARLAQTFGAGILKNESRIFQQLARSVIEGSDIILHTDGLSKGNFCYSSDALTALLILLTKGVSGEIYNISNEDTNMTIRQMAELVADKVASGRISVKYDIPDSNIFGYAVPTNIRLSSKKLRSLGWRPIYDLKQAYQRMIAYMLEEV